jgi:hypothetical protein
VTADTFTQQATPIAEALGRTPPQLVSLIHYITISFSPVDNGDFYAAAYDNDSHIVVYPQRIADAGLNNRLPYMLTHEMGHLLDFATHPRPTQGNPNPWGQAMVADGGAANQISIYGQTLIVEDFAETVAAYFAARGTPLELYLRIRMPNRFRILDPILIARGIPVTITVPRNNGPWVPPHLPIRSLSRKF